MFKFFLDKGLDPEKGGAGEGYKHGVMYDENPQLQRDVQSKAVSLSDYIYAYDQVFTNPDGTTKTYPIYAYKTPALALERELEKGRVTSMVNGEYDLVQKWTTTQTEDDLARIAIKACIDKDYAMTSNNCMHAVAPKLFRIGISILP